LSLEDLGPPDSATVSTASDLALSPRRRPDKAAAAGGTLSVIAHSQEHVGGRGSGGGMGEVSGAWGSQAADTRAAVERRGDFSQYLPDFLASSAAIKGAKTAREGAEPACSGVASAAGRAREWWTARSRGGAAGDGRVGLATRAGGSGRIASWDIEIYCTPRELTGREPAARGAQSRSTSTLDQHPGPVEDARWRDLLQVATLDDALAEEASVGGSLRKRPPVTSPPPPAHPTPSGEPGQALAAGRADTQGGKLGAPAADFKLESDAGDAVEDLGVFDWRLRHGGSKKVKGKPGEGGRPTPSIPPVPNTIMEAGQMSGSGPGHVDDQGEKGGAQADGREREGVPAAVNAEHIRGPGARAAGAPPAARNEASAGGGGGALSSFLTFLQSPRPESRTPRSRSNAEHRHQVPIPEFYGPHASQASPPEPARRGPSRQGTSLTPTPSPPNPGRKLVAELEGAALLLPPIGTGAAGTGGGRAASNGPQTSPPTVPTAEGRGGEGGVGRGGSGAGSWGLLDGLATALTSSGATPRVRDGQQARVGAHTSRQVGGGSMSARHAWDTPRRRDQSEPVEPYRRPGGGGSLSARAASEAPWHGGARSARSHELQEAGLSLLIRRPNPPIPMLDAPSPNGLLIL